MAKSLHRKIIAAVVAVAIIVTALGSHQAAAQTRNMDGALAALLGLAVVGAIIASKHKDERNGHVVTRDRPRRYDHHDGRKGRFGRDDRHHGVPPRPLPHRVQRQLLPAECLRNVQTHRGGPLRVFGGRCLARNYAFADRLPRECVRSLDGRRGFERGAVWDARCLRRNGYRISRH